MKTTTNECAVGFVLVIRVGVVAVGLGVALAAAPAVAQEAPSFVVQDFGVMPWQMAPTMLLGMPPVQEELKLTEAQTKEYEAILQRRMEKMQQARRDQQDLAKFREARDAIFSETEAAQQANLKPEQRERLAQILVQVQGPLAFARPEAGPFAPPGPPLTTRLKLSDDQVKRVVAIAQEGQMEIAKVARFPLDFDTKKGPPSVEAIRKFIDSSEFKTSKQKAREAGRAANTAVIRRIEEVLTDAQREAYHKELGAPFDLSKLHWGGQDERQRDLQMVGVAYGLGGQRADPDFNTKVDRPAYASAERHPRVLFDEAHHNFHTASGRYKPFAELITNDGYQVIPNGEKFSREVLKKGDILIIANALGAEGMGQPAASDAAFTDAECEAVRDWVKEGGALLFITDHAPMGAAAECLAKRLDVSLSKGATADPKNSEGGDTSLVFTRQNGLLGEHPITRGRDDSERVSRIQTFTGTSLKGPEGSVAILKLADTAVDMAFGDEKPVSAAGRAQGLVLSLGKGRVVMLGEAAELSAQVVGFDGGKFGMNVPGLDNRQMALNIMHWLSGLLEPRGAADTKGP